MPGRRPAESDAAAGDRRLRALPAASRSDHRRPGRRSRGVAPPAGRAPRDGAGASQAADRIRRASRGDRCAPACRESRRSTTRCSRAWSSSRSRSSASTSGASRSRTTADSTRWRTTSARTTTIASREDADAWLARLEALPAYYQQNIANLRRGIKTRYTQPRIVVDRVLEVARKQVPAKPEDSSLLLPFARMPASIPAAAQADYRAKALALVRDKISARAARVRRVPGARVRAGGAAGARAGARRRAAKPAIASWCGGKPRPT